MPRRRRSGLGPPGDALEHLLDGIAPEDGAGDVGVARLQRIWPRAVGPAIAAAGRPVALVDGVLHVACEDATWAHELQLLEPMLLTHLESAGVVGVTAIRARAGDSRGPRSGGPRRSRD